MKYGFRISGMKIFDKRFHKFRKYKEAFGWWDIKDEKIEPDLLYFYYFIIKNKNTDKKKKRKLLSNEILNFILLDIIVNY